MATLELEGDFVKGLRFMFSTSKEAPDSLRALLDEAIRAKYGTSKSLGTFQPAKVKAEEDYILTERHSDDSTSEKEEDDGGLDLEMMEEDLACAVCRGLNVGARNRLVECVECHALYHQECHRPNILDHEISDPRVAWYCSSCSRNMHRAAAPDPPPIKQSSSKSSSSSSSNSKSAFKSSGSSSSRDSPTHSKSSSRSESSSLFKRAEKTSSSSSSSGSSSHKSAPSGLAALAASLQPGSKSSSSSSSSSNHKSSSSSSSKSSSSQSGFSSSSKNFSSSGGSSSQGGKGSPSSPTLSGMNARLQSMKKKAAAKVQEKRKHSK